MSHGTRGEIRSTRGLADILSARGRVVILPHDYPDPDALASAAALHLWLERVHGVRSTIVFSGLVQRPENRELLRHFRYRWRLLDTVSPPKRARPALFVDTFPTRGNVTVPPWARPVGIVDHHPIAPEAVPPAWFADIRPHVGATATILFEYLTASSIAIPPWLAAIMAYAIETETRSFTRGTFEADERAYTTLISMANLRILGQIRHAPLPRGHFAQLREAIANARLYANVAWSHLPREAPPEVVAEVADWLLRLERVTWSFCTGIGEGRLWVSLRASRRDARCGQIVRDALQGQGPGGGHDRMAAGVLSLNGLSADEQERKLRELQLALLRRILPRARAADLESPEQIGRTLT